MLAKDIMTKKPEFLPPTATVKEAADIMRAQNFGFIPVGENDVLIGAITDRDIAIRSSAEGKDPSKTLVRDVMSKGIHFCLETDSLDKVAHQMEESKIRRIVVLNSEKRMTGVISLGDIATKGQDEKLCCELTDAVSQD